MEQRICPVCGTEFEARHWNQRYCEPNKGRCYRRATNHAQRIARGLSTVPLDAPFTEPYDCAQCGKHCVPGENVVPHASRFCATKCRAAWHHRHSEGRLSRGLRCSLSARPATRQWVEGRCPECGERLVVRAHASAVGYCSSGCKRRVAARRRRALTKAAPGAGLHEIAERDGWRCGLCGRDVDPMLQVPDLQAPTLDHVVPLAVGGTHSADNLQLAHFICNSVKGDGRNRAVGDQMALV